MRWDFIYWFLSERGFWRLWNFKFIFIVGEIVLKRKYDLYKFVWLVKVRVEIFSLVFFLGVFVFVRGVCVLLCIGFKVLK